MAIIEGTIGNDTLIGTDADDALYGYAGSDRLRGLGGADALDGGSGVDTALYDGSPAAVVVDLALHSGSGGDAEGDVLIGIENLTGSAHADILAGNAGSNTLIGRDGDDTLRGLDGDDRLLGGRGNDVLNGGPGVDVMGASLGDDIYYVEDAGDIVQELVDEGTDQIISTISFTAPANVEALLLRGTTDIDATGNELANVLAGNSGDNLIQGLAGDDSIDGDTGADTIRGGNGNDTLYGSDGGDLLAGGNGADVIRGDHARDVLRGSGGMDTLTGGGSDDVFVFDTAPRAANVDLIVDFTSGSDRIRLDDDVFTAFTAGVPVTADQFHAAAGATAAADAEDRIIYDTATGMLYYDADGTGIAAGALPFAQLGVSSHPTLTAQVFVIGA